MNEWNETITCTHKEKKKTIKTKEKYKNVVCPFRKRGKLKWAREYEEKKLFFERFNCEFIILLQCMSVLNICALTSDLFMAQFRHGFASLFHTRIKIIKSYRPFTKTREEKLNWIPSIFTDILLALTYTLVLKPNRVKYAANGTFHQTNVCGLLFMWATIFFLLLLLSSLCTMIVAMAYT